MDAERRLTGRDLGAHGTVRVTMPDAIVHLIASRMPEFESLYPNIALDLITGLSFSNLARMEADIAVRISSAPKESLVGRRIAEVEMHAYGERGLIDSLAPRSLAHVPWVGWTDEFSHFPMERWLRRHVAKARIRFTVNTTTTLITMIKSGAGVGFLPSFRVHTEPSLKRLAEPSVPTFKSQAWVLMHEDVKGVPRVQAVSRWLVKHCKDVLNET